MVLQVLIFFPNPSSYNLSFSIFYGYLYLLSSYIVTYAYVISVAVTKAAQIYIKEYVYYIHDYKRDLKRRVLNICQGI